MELVTVRDIIKMTKAKENRVIWLFKYITRFRKLSKFPLPVNGGKKDLRVNLYDLEQVKQWLETNDLEAWVSILQRQMQAETLRRNLKDNPIGAPELAKRLGLTVREFNARKQFLITEYDFPKHAIKYANAYWWRKSEVESWAPDVELSEILNEYNLFKRNRRQASTSVKNGKGCFDRVYTAQDFLTGRV